MVASYSKCWVLALYFPDYGAHASVSTATVFFYMYKNNSIERMSFIDPHESVQADCSFRHSSKLNFLKLFAGSNESFRCNI
jgi:hypothetical protein